MNSLIQGCEFPPLEVQNGDGFSRKGSMGFASGDEVEPENEGNSNEMLIQRFRNRKKKDFAGMTLDDKVSWKSHVQNVSTCLGQKIKSLRRLKGLAP